MQTNDAGHEPLDPAIADKLLEKLSSDDSFRSQFSSNPAGALISLGVPEAAANLATSGNSCLCTRNLASKQEIAATREALLSYLTSKGTHTVVHAFELGETAAKLR